MTSNSVVAHGLLIESKDGQEKICSVIARSHEFQVFFSEIPLRLPLWDLSRGCKIRRLFVIRKWDVRDMPVFFQIGFLATWWFSRCPDSVPKTIVWASLAFYPILGLKVMMIFTWKMCVKQIQSLEHMSWLVCLRDLSQELHGVPADAPPPSTPPRRGREGYVEKMGDNTPLMVPKPTSSSRRNNALLTVEKWSYVQAPPPPPQRRVGPCTFGPQTHAEYEAWSWDVYGWLVIEGSLVEKLPIYERHRRVKE